MAVLNKDPKYKEFFSYRKFTEDALKEVFRDHPQFIDQLDLSTLQQAPTELISKDFKVRYADTVWLCKHKHSKQHVYFPLEFQTNPDRRMPVRILVYSALLIETFAKKAGRGQKDRLPPVLATVFYHGNRRWRIPLNFKCMFDKRMFDPLGNAELTEQLASVGYQLVEEQTRVVDPLPKERSLYLAMLGIIFCSTPLQACDAVQVVERWLSDEPEDQELKQTFDDLFNSVMEKEFSEDETMGYMTKQFRKSIRRWKEKERKEARMEGHMEGRMEGLKDTLQKQLMQKFGDIPAADKKRIEAAPFEQVEKWINRIIGANSLEELFGN